MAQVTMTICDLHQQRGEQVPGAPRSFTIDGFTAKPDLCDECYEANVGPLLAFLHSMGDAPRLRSQTRAARRGRSSPVKIDASAVRAWATENGIEVASRGKLRQDVLTQYRAAHT